LEPFLLSLNKNFLLLFIFLIVNFVKIMKNNFSPFSK